MTAEPSRVERGRTLRSPPNSSSITITELAKQVWLNSHSITFGQAESWPEDLFTEAWAGARRPRLAWRTYEVGWYWFLTSASLAELCAIPRPDRLPGKACDISTLSTTNVETFGAELLCRPGEDGQVVVYNGHEGKVCNRVRSHFALRNNQTGALGLKHFPLHDRAWEVRVFASPCLQSLPPASRRCIERLMNSRSGRRAVETAWRAVYGWPVLCRS